MQKVRRAFWPARRPTASLQVVAWCLVLMVAGAVGGQVAAASPAALTAPWTRIRHSLLTSNDWVLALPDDPKASQLGECSRRSKPSWVEEVADRPEGSVPSRPDVGGRSQPPGASWGTSRWSTPFSARGPPGRRSS